MKRAVIGIWFLLVLALGGGAWWYLFAPGKAPDGQRPLGDATDFQQSFRAGVEKFRIVAVLSPTTPSDLVIAHQLQALLMEYENNSLDAHVVWQPAVSTDWAPTTDAMARVWDPRARHYWDKGKEVPGAAKVQVFARGAGLDAPAVRVDDWKAGLPKIREFLGTPAKRN